MDLEERHHLQDYVEGLLAGWGVEGPARVNKRLVEYESGLFSPDEVIEVCLPEAAGRLGVKFVTRLSDFVANFLRGKRSKSVVTICEPSGKPLRWIEFDRVPPT
jgi:hypothetical protein